jgi:low affinity Fe/Cu permease
MTDATPRRRRSRDDDVEMPSEVSAEISVFDRFATTVSQLVSRATFFLFCVLLVAVWLPSILVIGKVDTWQLIINTVTTIITFLMVALLQNTQRRSEQAMHQKLNAIAQGLADLMGHQAEHGDHDRLAADRRELQAAIGLESKESSAHNRR